MSNKTHYTVSFDIVLDAEVNRESAYATYEAAHAAYMAIATQAPSVGAHAAYVARDKALRAYYDADVAYHNAKALANTNLGNR